MRIRKLTLVAAAVALAAAACTTPGDPASRTATPETTIDLEGLMTIEEAVDLALTAGDVDLVADFCAPLADARALGGEEVFFQAFSQGLDGAAEDFGFTDRQIFDEMAARY